MKSPKILIIGFGSVLNYGGEAIVQGTCRMLFDTWPDAKVTVATDDIPSAQNVLGDYKQVSIIQSQKRVTIHRLLMGVLRRLGFGEGSPVRVNLGIVKGHDIVLSVGGDNFVQNPAGKISLLLEDLVKVGEKAKKNGMLYCLWGASVGPFDDQDCFKKISAHLKKADLITVREIKAQNYLKTMGCTHNVELVGDPAFCMEPENPNLTLRQNDDQIVIGVNVSRLAIDVVFGEDVVNAISLLANSINMLFDIDSNIKIVLIPHVVSSIGGAQDDYTFLNELKSMLAYPQRVTMAPYGLGSRKTKGLMQKCDIVIAARMHCFVGSVSAGTPALMIAYSDKGYGMTRYVYGEEKWVVGLDVLNPASLQSKVSNMLQWRVQINEELQQQSKHWHKDAKKAVEALFNVYMQTK